jgi:hypothetical protein
LARFRLIGVACQGHNAAIVFQSIHVPSELSSDGSGGGSYLGDAR